MLDTLFFWNLWWNEQHKINAGFYDRPKKKVKKRFVLECKHTGRWSKIFGDDKWHTYHKYKTEKSRDQALKDLSKKGSEYLLFRRGKDL